MLRKNSYCFLCYSADNIIYTKTLFICKKCNKIYKTKKYPIVVSNDLMLNPLDINHNNTFILIENTGVKLCNFDHKIDNLIVVEKMQILLPNYF